MKHWKVTQEDEYFFEAKDPWNNYAEGEFFWHVRVKRDGCMELIRRFNSPQSSAPCDDDQIHLCSVNEVIEMLQELKVEMERRGFETH